MLIIQYWAQVFNFLDFRKKEIQQITSRFHTAYYFLLKFHKLIFL